MRAQQLVATLPCNFTEHARAHRRRITLNRVPDMVGFFAHISNDKPTQHTSVMRLATACGIERCAIERYRIVTAGNHRGFKRREVCVVKINQLGQ
jgi:uridine phosphorylase